LINLPPAFSKLFNVGSK